MYLKADNNWFRIAVDVSYYRWPDPSGDFFDRTAAVPKTYDQFARASWPSILFVHRFHLNTGISSIFNPCYRIYVLLYH